MHDTAVDVSVNSTTLAFTGTGSLHYAPGLDEYVGGNEGTLNRNASMAMEPNGSMVVAWTQDYQNTDSAVAGQNIYYRNYNENSVAVGPNLDGLVDSNEEPIGNGPPSPPPPIRSSSISTKR